MLEALWFGAVTVDKPSDRQMSITDARHVAVGTLEAVFAAIFEKRLSWKGLLSGQKTYSALLVDADEVTDIVRTGPARANFTKEEVREFIPGLGKASVEKLIRAGHLELIEEFSNEARRSIPVVTRASAEAFKLTHVTLGELTQNESLHHKQVRKALKDGKVAELYDADAMGSFIYMRQKTSNIDWDKARLEGAEKKNKKSNRRSK